MPMLLKYRRITSDILMSVMVYRLTIIKLKSQLKLSNYKQGGAPEDRNWGGGHMFIYSCSQTLKTIDFKI